MLYKIDNPNEKNFTNKNTNKFNINTYILEGKTLILSFPDIAHETNLRKVKIYKIKYDVKK